MYTGVMAVTSAGVVNPIRTSAPETHIPDRGPVNRRGMFGSVGAATTREIDER